jgi:hypothetical protein
MWTQPPQSPSDSDLRRRQGCLARQPLGPVSRLALSGSSWLTEKNRALCISPNGTYIGGYATRTQSSPAVQEQTAVSWSGTTLSSLFTEPTLQLGRGGEARAVNNSGEFAGSRTLENSVGQFIPRAFRSRTNGAAVLATDYLVPPHQEGVVSVDVPCRALAISPRANDWSGVVVGWTGKEALSQWYPRPSVWWQRTNNSPEPTNSAWLELPYAATAGEATSITSAGVIFGWISFDAGVSRKAWRWPNGWSAGGGFDDKMNTYGFSELWSLEDIVDATDLEVILGNGTKSGSKRAFLLIPQLHQN